MVMTLKDHADVEAEGTLSPYQRRARAIQARIADATALRDREERRLRRLRLALGRCKARIDIAQLEIMVGMEQLREMKA